MATFELIRPAEYARRRGVSAAALSKAIRRCGIPLVEGKLDPLVADTLWRARTDPLQQARANGQKTRSTPGQPAGSSFQADIPDGEDWRRRRERAEAELAEIELEEKRGALVSKIEVERGSKMMASAIVQHHAAVPDRISAEFGVDDEHRRKLRARLRQELDQIRAELARAGLLGEQ